MKMNKSLIALCLSAGLLASAPGISLADVNYVPQNTSDAPAIPSAALQQLTWTPVDQSKTQTTQLATGGQQLNVPGISGPVAAYSVPANIGEPVSYTHLTLPTIPFECRSRWSPYH